MSVNMMSGVCRASAVLPAAGAFDATLVAIPSNTFDQITFLISYTRGAVGGAISYKVEVSNDLTTWYQLCETQSGTVTPGSDVVDPSQRVAITYQSASASQENFTSPTFSVVTKYYRIGVRESGVVGTPGSASVEYTLRGGV